MSLDSYSLWLASTVAAVVTLLAAGAAFVFYTYLISRLPDAVWLRNLKQRVLELDARVAEKSKELDGLTEQFHSTANATRDAVDAMARAVDEKNLAEQWLQENAENIAKIPKWKDTIEELRKQGEDAKAKLLEVQQQRIDMQQKVDELQFKTDQLKRESQDLETKYRRTQEETKLLEQQVSEYQIKASEVRAVLAEQRARLDTLQAELSSIQQKISAANSLLDSTNREAAAAKSLLAESLARKDSVQREIDEMQRSLADLRTMLSTLSKNVNDWSNAIKPPMLQERLEDYNRPLLMMPENYSSNTSDEGVALQRLSEKIASAGYIFHERTIHAFHTSLKISDISPLVVLAGISGTGKSQLPRLYAKYMGLHFLNVSVQPRWDAPEDLFGFYNYMEHRYKATELARGLRQMDSHFHRADTEDSTELQKGMLLVLMDEMNLARVEYYFSELLSKLEMRSRGRLDDEEMHTLASIQIQAGSLTEEDGVNNRPLFVGYNVLFVGTMNEDETTQALSDKVIDRSNVLRFGRPAKTHSGVLTELTEEEPLLIDHQAWEDWIAGDPGGKDRDRIAAYCQRLNEALEKVGRPFGHRIHQAISQYIANYPHWVENRFEKAFADQLEQKILPKLRGLSNDTDEHLEDVLNVVGGIVNDLGDAQLADAFSAARQHPVFDFRGVNRGS